MKTQRKHGFTIVELVIVIAVIAILAAVLIPTFVSIIKKANDSAYVQERQSQRIDDIAQKIDNETWVSWEQMEVKIAEAIAGINKETIGKDDVSAAIQTALEEYAAAHQSGNTGVTPEQVKKIVEETTKGNVTLEQVQALIAKIPTGTPGVTTAQVQAIVNQALAGVSASAGLNATQVNNLIKSYLESHPTDNAAAIQSAVASALANLKTLSEEDVVAIVNNITSTSASVITLTGTEDGNGYTVTSDNAGKTVYLMTSLSSTETYTISGENVKKVVIDAPNMTDVVVDCNAEEVVVIRTAMTSVHITGTVGKVEINSGHVEVEPSATVTTLKAAPSTNATVKVTVEGAVTTLNAEYQDHGTGTNDTIEIVYAGTIGTSNLTASEALEASGETTTNVSLTKVGEATTPALTASVAIPADTEVSVNTAAAVDATPASTTPITVNASTGEGEYASYVARIGSTGYETLQAAIDAAQSGETVVLLKDVSISSIIGITNSITIDGNGHSVSTTSTSRAFNVDGVDNLKIKFTNIKISAPKAERGISFYNTKNLELEIDGCDISASNYAINFASLTTIDVTINNSTISGWAALNIWSDGISVSVFNSTLEGYNNKSYSSWNTFSTICFEGDSTHKTTLHSSNMNVYCENTTIIARSSETGNKQYAVGFNSQCLNNKAKFVNCEFVLEDESLNKLYYCNGSNCSLDVNGLDYLFDFNSVVDSTNLVIDGDTATGSYSFIYNGTTYSVQLSDTSSSEWNNGSYSGTDYVVENFNLNGNIVTLDLDISTCYELGYQLYVF